MATTEAEPVPITDAARQLQMGYWRMRDAILRGELVGYKIAGRWFVTPISLREYVVRKGGER